MPRVFGDQNYLELVRPPNTSDGELQVFPRLTKYGSVEAAESGLVPLLDYPDRLIRPEDYEEVIRNAHQLQTFPSYHLLASGVMDAGWNQDGYGYCWSYGLTAAVMTARAVENQSPVRLSPFSLGWLVGWKNRGFYLDAAIKGAKTRGIAPVEYVPEYELNTNRFREGWEQVALSYRVTEWWDTRKTSDAEMLQQAIAILATSRACYVAYNWWGHALLLIGLQVDTSAYLGVRWVLWNSHNENEPIYLTGQRGVPDELYGVRTTSFPAEA